jgi:hypothetical protein
VYQQIQKDHEYRDKDLLQGIEEVVNAYHTNGGGHAGDHAEIYGLKEKGQIIGGLTMASSLSGRGLGESKLAVTLF